jgi:hypothetical protein
MSDASLTLAEWLRAAFAGQAAGCPPPEVWLRKELAALPPAERARLELHATDCPACSAERELCRAFDAGTGDLAAADVAWVTERLESAPTPPAALDSPSGRVVRFPRRQALVRWGRLAAAAVLVVAAGLMFQTVHLGDPPLPTPRQHGPVRGGTIELLAPLGDLPAMPQELLWRPLPGATAYRVHLLAVDDTMLWEGSTSPPSIALPADVTATLHRSVSYHWRVIATAADGTVIGRSEMAAFRVTPEAEIPMESQR